MRKKSGGGGAGMPLNLRGEEFELAFDWLEGETRRVGHDPAVGALKPFGAVALARQFIGTGR